MVIASSKEHLWRFVVQGSCICEHVNFITPLNCILTDSEINDLDVSASLVVQYIFRLYISVAYFVFMQIDECLDNVFHDFFQLLKLIENLPIGSRS